MSVSGKTGGGAGVSKKVKVERPRPLKIGGGTQPELGVEDLLVVVDSVRRSLAVVGVGAAAQPNFDLKNQLEVLIANLKISGPALETNHKVKINICAKIGHFTIFSPRTRWTNSTKR